MSDDQRPDNVIELPGGTTVTLRTSFPMSEFADIMQSVYDANLGDLNSCIPMLVNMVEGGDVPGDPDDPGTYQQMDAVREIYPLARKTIDYVEELAYGDPKNAEDDSSSA